MKFTTARSIFLASQIVLASWCFGVPTADTTYAPQDINPLLEQWKSALKSKPDSVDAVMRVSELELLSEGHEVAQKTLLNFIAEKNESLTPNSLWKAQKKLVEMQTRFVKDESQSLYFQSLAKVKLQDFSQALSLLNQADQLERGNFRILESKARCERELGQFNNYYETLKSAVQLVWVDQGWRDNLVEAQYYFKDFSDVISWAELQTSLVVSTRQKIALAMSMIEKGENHKAAIILFQVLDSSRDFGSNPIVWYGLGRAHRKQKNLKPAIRYFEKFLSVAARSKMLTSVGWDPYKTSEKLDEAKQWLLEVKQSP